MRKLIRKDALAPGEIILHRIGEHDGEPEKAPDRGKPDQPGAPSYVHKEKHHKCHLREGYKQCDKCIRTREDKVEIDGRYVIRQHRPDDQHSKNAEITRNTNMFVLVF